MIYLKNFRQKHNSRNLKQTHTKSPPHHFLSVRTVPCKTAWHDMIWYDMIWYEWFALEKVRRVSCQFSDAPERTLWRRPLPVRLVVGFEFRNVFKAYLNFWHSKLYQKIHELIFLAPKPLYKFSIEMRTLASPGCCVIWSGLHQGVIGEAIDHVAWTAARLCENWWTRLQTLAGIIWTLLDSYLMWHFDFYVEASYLTL